MTKHFGFRSIITTTTSTGGTAEVAQLLSINGPNSETDDVDTTTMDSSSNYRTFQAGIVDPGEVELEGLYDPALASHKILVHSQKERENRTWTIYHGSTSGDSDQFTGYVKSMGREIPMEEMIKFTATIKITGVPGWTT